MAGLIKELLLDLAISKLTSEEKCDLLMAIKKNIQSGNFTRTDINILELYLFGYTSVEIAELLQSNTAHIEIVLTRMMKVIETISGYSDVSFIRRVEKLTNYPKQKINKMGVYLIKHGQKFTSHDVKERVD